METNMAKNRTSMSPTNQPFISIVPPQGWGKMALPELWEYRELLWFWTLRGIKARYRQMALGPLWVLLNPIIYMLIFSVIFGGLAKLPSEGVPYPVFTYVALLPWHYFFDVVNFSSTSLLREKEVMSKIYFPRLIFP
ncbi:ABC-2 type transporter, partial [Candidatus Thiomargarita nelsonii]